jgi:hypothetical protein
MKNGPGSPLVQVNVEVSVSLPGLEPVVRSLVAPCRDLLGTIFIDIPDPPTATAQVWTDPTTGSRFICAKGHLSAFTSPVYAKVYPGNVEPDPSPPTGDATVKQTTPASSGNFIWEFTRAKSNLLPIDHCAASGQDLHKLAVWADFGGGFQRAKLTFNAVCSTQTDCDGSGAGAEFTLAGAGYPVLAAPPAAHPPLAVSVVKKTGRFRALPERAELHWKECQQGWVWVPEQAHCGTFTVLPCSEWFVLHSTVSKPPIISARADSTLKPLHLIFEATAAGQARRPEEVVLEVHAAGGSSSGR